MSYNSNNNIHARLPVQAAPIARTAEGGTMHGGVEPNFLPLLFGALTSLLK
jgi:hypothetical protein